jgi:nitrogen PTS system EIIA component
MLLSDLLDDRCIDLNLAKGKKSAVLSHLVRMADTAGAVTDADGLLKELITREKQTTTAIGGGIAIPHKLSPYVRHSVLGFGKCDEGVSFSAPDSRPVVMFFLLLAPENAVNEHLRILSRLARYLHDQSFQTRLMNARTPEDVRAAFTHKENE